jgi:hypothetical protein
MRHFSELGGGRNEGSSIVARGLMEVEFVVMDCADTRVDVMKRRAVMRWNDLKEGMMRMMRMQFSNSREQWEL